MTPAAMDEFFAPDATFVIGNAPPLEGREAIHAGTSAFHDTIASLHHTIVSVTEDDGKVFVRLKVTYGRHDGQSVETPAVVYFEEGDAGITRYDIYTDLTPVYA